MAGPIKRISPNPPGGRWGERTIKVVNCLREFVQVGDILYYAMCKAHTGIDLQRHNTLCKSVKALALEYGIVLLAVPGEGYRRLSEPGKVEKHDYDFQRIHWSTKRIQSEQATVDVRQLSPLGKHRHLAQQSLAGGVGMWTHAAVRKRLYEAKEPVAFPVPFDVEAHKDLFRRQLGA